MRCDIFRNGSLTHSRCPVTSSVCSFCQVAGSNVPNFPNFLKKSQDGGRTICSSGASLIRKLFTEGARLKKEYGVENVFDFSLGNPALEPPKAVQDAIVKIASNPAPLSHGYMPGNGYEFARESMAKFVEKYQGVNPGAGNVMMTSGAAGALNVIMRTLLDPEDEVIFFAPYFPEYFNFVTLHNGVPVVVKCNDKHEPDVEKLEAAITPKTRAVIINTPNNPTGKVYSQEIVDKIGAVVEKKSEENGHAIFLLSDEPYMRLIYDEKLKHPSVLKACKHSMVIGSFSKDLSIPGERMGFIALNPRVEESGAMIAAMSTWIRTLGFVNANAFFQRVVTETVFECIDISWYDERRKRVIELLRGMGLEVEEPEGAFYAFPRMPDDIDVDDLVAKLVTKRVLCVPGKAFGAPRNIRLCLAVTMHTVEKGVPLIKEAIDELRAEKK